MSRIEKESVRIDTRQRKALTGQETEPEMAEQETVAFRREVSSGIRSISGTGGVRDIYPEE
jgi:hypothetical protein